MGKKYTNPRSMPKKHLYSGVQVTDHVWLDTRYNVYRRGYYMSYLLALNLLGLPKYLDAAWDVVGIVSGHGKVRIGKTEIKGSKVLMADGEWKNVENIKEGDLVISPDIKSGRYTFAKVIKTHSRFCNEVYEICNRNNNDILYSCSDNHEIPIEYTKTKHSGNKVFGYERIYTTIEAKDLAKKSSCWLRNQGVVTYQGFFIDKFKDQKNATIEPYSLGVYLGDGNSSIKNHYLSIACSSKEAMTKVNKYYPVMSTKAKRLKCNIYRYSITSEFFKELIKYNLEGKISGNKFIPEECKKSDSNYRLRLLAGLIDTDGYINKQGIITYTTKSQRLAKDIQEVCRSLGGNSNIKKIIKTIKSNNFKGQYYNVQINLGKFNKSIPIKRPFKIQRIKGNKQEKNKVGVIAKKSKSEMVYGFEIDSESHLYITDNYSVTHNSTIAQQVGYFIAWMMAGGRMDHVEVEGTAYPQLKVVKSPDKEVHFTMENIVFSPEELMRKASDLYNKYGRNQVIIYDEGRAGLDSARAMEAINKVMQDFFQECGQYGHIILIVLPNYFRLHEDYAINRSLFLIDVYANQRLQRGFFNFYNELQKEFLYHSGRKKLGTALKYAGVTSSFPGRFTQFLPLDKDEYEAAKRKALKKKQITRLEVRWKKRLNGAIYLLKRETEWENDKIAEQLSVVSGDKVSEQMVRWSIQSITHKSEE